MFSFPDFAEILFWFMRLVTLSVIALQLWACIILLKERSMAAGLMLGGAVLSAAGFLGSEIMRLLSGGAVGGFPHPALVVCGMSASLLFFGGLLLHAWKLRPADGRLQELESMLAERNSESARLASFRQRMKSSIPPP